MSETENYVLGRWHIFLRDQKEKIQILKLLETKLLNKDLLSKPNPYDQTREPKYKAKNQQPSLTSTILKSIEKHEICRLSLKLEI